MDHFLVCLFFFAVCGVSNLVQAKQGNNHGGSCSPSLSIESFQIPIKVGDNVIIKCKACGRKDTFWFKDGKRFGETKRVHWIPARKISSHPLVVEGKLKIENLRKKDSGVYTCYALNFFTNIMEKGEIKLVVKGHNHIPRAKHI